MHTKARSKSSGPRMGGSGDEEEAAGARRTPNGSPRKKGKKSIKEPKNTELIRTCS